MRKMILQRKRRTNKHAMNTLIYDAHFYKLEKNEMGIVMLTICFCISFIL